MRQKTWILTATISASSMAFISQSALNSALPAIQGDLGASGADLLWIVNIFQLFLGALILIGGALGDMYGRKRIFAAGIGVFTAASVLAGFAGSTNALIAFRALMGLGGALMVPGSLAIISASIPSSERGQAIGIWSAFTTMTSILGPVLGGFFVDIGFWRAVFFINVPLGLIALSVLLAKVPESRDETRSGKADIPGAVSATLALGSIVFGATEIGRLGINSPRSLVPALLFLAGIAGMFLFIYIERRSSEPMVKLQLFENPIFSGTNLLTLMLYGALGGALFFFPLNLIQIQGYTALQSGLAFVPFSILLMTMSPWVGRLSDRFGPRNFLLYGPLVVAAGFVLLGLPGITSGVGAYWKSYFPGVLLLGIGMGLVVSPLTSTVMGCVKSSNAGIASGINNAISRAAGVIATALLGMVALLVFSASLESSLSAFSPGTDFSAENGGMESNEAGAAMSDDQIRLLLEESDELAATTVPDSFSPALKQRSELAIRESFVHVFRIIMFIAAGLAVVSSLFTGIFVAAKKDWPQSAGE